jgi:hypothetical protein
MAGEGILCEIIRMELKAFQPCTPVVQRVVPFEIIRRYYYKALHYVPRIKSQMIEQCLSITISNIPAKHI